VRGPGLPASAPFPAGFPDRQAPRWHPPARASPGRPDERACCSRTEYGEQYQEYDNRAEPRPSVTRRHSGSGALLSPKKTTGQRLGRCGAQSIGAGGAVSVIGELGRGSGTSRQQPAPGAAVVTGQGLPPRGLLRQSGPGLALAIWARIYLGGNWGMPMSEKVDGTVADGRPSHLFKHSPRRGRHRDRRQRLLAARRCPARWVLYLQRLHGRAPHGPGLSGYVSPYKQSTKMLMAFLF
jgi:hypothetical protein